MRAFSVLALVVAVASLSACGEELCTDVLRIETIQVLDQAGEPAADVQVVVTNTRTGAVLDAGEPMNDIGRYVILSDEQVPELVKSGDELRVTGSKDGLSFTATYIARADRCHVTGLEGPETVQLAE